VFKHKTTHSKIISLNKNVSIKKLKYCTFKKSITAYNREKLLLPIGHTGNLKNSN